MDFPNEFPQFKNPLLQRRREERFRTFQIPNFGGFRSKLYLQNITHNTLKTVKDHISSKLDDVWMEESKKRMRYEGKNRKLLQKKNSEGGQSSKEPTSMACLYRHPNSSDPLLILDIWKQSTMFSQLAI
ncbi:hypothetical protein CDAR_18941 [Caerostris darwini]|uniref:Ycf1 n=1 Tax=Caerostris darwini TaxID=1538125 RepID=A0AAV4WE07_9ARAC|nr:hypothetical protein CDAR_18941 [Caerostris darwini]